MDTFVALDFETANRERSSVCSIGLVFVESGRTTDTYYRLIRPLPNYHSHYNTAVHGLTTSDTASAAPFPEIWQELLPMIGSRPLVAHKVASTRDACVLY